MKKLLKSSLSLAMAGLMSLSMFAHAGEAVADDHSSSVSYNIGFMSEYWYRGVYQSDSAVSFGADYEAGSFYAGTWWACLLYTSPSPRDGLLSRMPSSA